MRFAKHMFASLGCALALLLGAPTTASAQTATERPAAQAYRGPDIAAQRAAMEKVAWLAGKWEGPGWVIMPDGQKRTFRQTEDVATRLDGQILVIEGAGFTEAAPGAPSVKIFNAFGIVSYDDVGQKYAFRAYAEGRANTMEARVREDGAFEWSMKPPGRLIRYIITQPTQNTWHEVGETSTDDGKTWLQFFEMTLQRK